MQMLKDLPPLRWEMLPRLVRFIWFGVSVFLNFILYLRVSYGFATFEYFFKPHTVVQLSIAQEWPVKGLFRC